MNYLGEMGLCTIRIRAASRGCQGIYQRIVPALVNCIYSNQHVARSLPFMQTHHLSSSHVSML
jgi:hypothetical protein